MSALGLYIDKKEIYMNINQYKFTGNDESYTYPSLIKPLIPFIEKFRISKNIKNRSNLTIWCPFDLKEDMEYNGIKMFRSNYIDIFEKEGYNVIASHIATGQDFFKYEPPYFDVIISNPPFRNKALFFERAITLNKPFALVCPASWLNDGGSIVKLFRNKRLQLLIPDKRAKFFNENGKINKGISFKSIYYCVDFLVDKDIEWFELDRSLER